MISCRQLLSELSNYLDDETEPQVREELERHIAKCPDCWVIFDSTRKTIQIYQGCEPYALPQPLHHKLQEALRKQYEQSQGKDQ
ncbi:MAG: zf-HC2 domain-containing protein [Acidobacteria bacterium]|nr:zf-HC2 domain-containing protein [Acidobacteriota bacterium]